jgi:hypothetical protein
MPYKAFYIARSDGDWDFVAAVADKEEVDPDIVSAVEIGIKRALGWAKRYVGDFKEMEFNEPDFVAILNGDRNDKT